MKGKSDMATAVLEKLEQGEQEAVVEYRNLALKIVEGEEVDNHLLRSVLFDAGKSMADLRADVDNLKSRRSATENRQRVGELERQFRELEAKHQELSQEYERVRQECDQRLREAERPIAELNFANRQRALRIEIQTISTDTRALLLRTVDPAIEIRCDEIRGQIRQHDESRRFNLEIIEGKRNFEGILLPPGRRKSRSQWESEHKAAKHHVARLDKVDEATRQQAESRVSQCERMLERIAVVEASVAAEQREIERLSAELDRLEASKLDWRNAAIR
jgi:prefoldin subunit 5